MTYYVYNPHTRTVTKHDKHHNAYYMAIAKNGILYRYSKKHHNRIILADYTKALREQEAL